MGGDYFFYLYPFITFGLVILFMVSIILFIRKLLINSSNKNRYLPDVEQKLDRIIELLEKQEKK